MPYIPPKTEYAPEGSVFYVVVEYPSYICRVQKMIAGPNGKFSQRLDKSWMHHGTWAYAYIDKSEAEEDAKAVNFRNCDELEERVNRAMQTYYDLVAYTRGDTRL